MARNTDLSSLSTAALEQILNRRRKDADRLRKRREGLMKKIAAIDEQIVKLGGSGGGRARNASSLADVIHDILQRGGKAMRVRFTQSWLPSPARCTKRCCDKICSAGTSAATVRWSVARITNCASIVALPLGISRSSARSAKS